MRTSEEIYHRVRWDPRFDPARFVLGVNVRGAAPKRVPLPAFVPGGDIPWHRVLFIEADGELVWDRAASVDRIDDTPAGRVRAARLLRPPFFTAGTPHRWDGHTWSPVPPEAADPSAVSNPPGPTRAYLRVLTWNTLWDRYDSDRIDTVRRRPLLLAELERADADVIALQEVERGLLDALLATPWIRAGYAIDVRPTSRDIDNSGVLLLSRLPIRESGRHPLGPYKAVAAITVATATGPMVVAATHLTSDHTADGAQRRTKELAGLAEGLGEIDADLVVVGDFNDSGAGPQQALGLRDAWSEVRGTGDTTPTFDPTVNPLAAVSSLTGRAGRLDRVLLRGPALRVSSVGLRGDVPTADGLFASDHYGVLADLAYDDTTGPEALDVPPTARTALAWIPPQDLWPPLQRIRQHHDPQVHRWPPHVNVLFGFVPEAEFDRAVPLVVAAAEQLPPFPARLDGVRSFRHPGSTTVWLDPAAADPRPWADLHAALLRRFPRCAGRSGGYTPHLTLGRADPAEVSAPAPVSTVVGELVLLSRRGDEPMRPRVWVDLGTGAVRWMPETRAGDVARADPRTDRRAVLARRIADRVTAALADGVVEVVGSRRMGCAGPDSDLDLVAVLPPGTDVEARVRAVLSGLDVDAERLRPVLGARVPGFRTVVGGLRVDLVVVETATVPPAEAVARRAELDEAAAVAVSAVSDADAVRAAVGSRGEAFAALARTVKAWARARGLDSAPHGGLPGLAWAVLAARTVCEADPAVPAADLVREFFGRWAAWDWRHAVTLTGSAGSAGPASSAGPAATPVTVRCPSAPVRSCSEQVGTGWRDLLTHELYEAWETCESTVDDLVTPPPLHRRHAAWAVVTVRAADLDAAALDAAVGRVRGRTRALLTALEEAGVADAHAWPRPFHSGQPDVVTYAIGLGRTPPDAATLGVIAEPWVAGLPMVEVSWAECGAVPTLR